MKETIKEREEDRGSEENGGRIKKNWKWSTKGKKQKSKKSITRLFYLKIKRNKG